MGLNVELLEKSFALVAPKGDALVVRFYERLFQAYPSVKPLFKNASPAEQRKKLLASLVLVIQSLRRPDQLTKALRALGARHVGYGAQPAHYDAVAETLLAVLAEFAGAAWTPAVRRAWTEALGAIKTIMLEGAAAKGGTARETGNPRRGEQAMWSWFGNIKTMRKLMSGFALVGAIMAGVGYIGVSNMERINSATENIYDVQLKPLMTLTKVRGLVHQVRGWVLVAVLTKDKADQVQAVAKIQELAKQSDENMQAFEKSIRSEEVRKSFEEFRKALSEYRAVRDGTVLKLAQEGNQAGAIAAMKGEGAARYKHVIETINNVVDVKTKIADGKYNEAAKTYGDSKLILTGIIAGGIALGLVIGWLIARFLSRNLADVITAAQGLGSGDLKARSSVTTHDEVGQLAQAFNDMGEKLQASAAKQQEMVSTLDNAQANLLMCDRNLVITYVNQGALKKFKELEPEIRKFLPTFDAGKLVGACIDGFHKDAQRIRRILDNPQSLPHRADIQIGPVTLDLLVNAIRTADGIYTGNSLEWMDVTVSRKMEVEMARLRSALDNASTNVMVCDRNYQIVYVNTASQTALRKIEADVQKLIPAFRADKVLGSSIDMYHKNAAHQRQLLDNPKNLPHHTEIKLGPLTLDLTAAAIVNDKGEYVGNVVEWADITGMKNAQIAVDKLVTAATNGELSERINAEEFEGAYKVLSLGINRLLEAVVTPLNEAQATLGALAQGDLTKQMTGVYQGEFDAIKSSLNTALANLTKTVQAVREGAESVTTGSEQISRGNEDLSQRTSEQASALEETSSSMEEMTSTVKQNADNAKQANQLAIAARDVAEKGGAVTTKAVEAMGEINKSSKKIADIITVIDEIAFQTNLLALNAAVEAARAGEHGRGFAVVAAEVRNLAQRSATAAKEIKGLINESIQRVTDGSTLVDQSGKTLEEIVGSVKRVTDIIAEIAAASQEQASGIDQVNKAIMQMDETTQQNAALVEEATSASQSMKEQAVELMRQVNFFKLTGTGAERSGRPSGGAARQDLPATTHKPVAKPTAKSAAHATGHKPAAKEPVGVGGGGNGQDRRRKEDDFEEF